MAKKATPKKAPRAKPSRLDGATLRKWHHTMLLIRKFDENADRLFQEGHVKGTIHTSIGQEATSMGVCANLSNEDVVLAQRRANLTVAMERRPDRQRAGYALGA